MRFSSAICSEAVNLGKHIYASSTSLKCHCFAWAAHTHTRRHPKPYQKYAWIIYENGFLFRCGWKMCVCVCAVVIRRRHHGTKHETKRNKIILWHWLMVLRYKHCCFCHYTLFIPFTTYAHTHTPNGRHSAHIEQKNRTDFTWIFSRAREREREKKNVNYKINNDEMAAMLERNMAWILPFYVRCLTLIMW